MLLDDVRAELVCAIHHALNEGKRTIHLSLPHRLYVTRRQSLLFEQATAGNFGYQENLDKPIANLLQTHRSELLEHVGSRANFIDLGPGYPSKSLYLVDELIRKGVEITYYAVDISPYFLRRAVAAVHARNVNTISLEERFEDLGPILDHKLAPPIPRVIFLGLTFNNFPVDMIVQTLAEITRPGDICLICHQPSCGVSEAGLLGPYLGKEVQAFAFEPLRIAGLNEDDVEYRPRMCDHAIETCFVAKGDKPWDGSVIPDRTEFVTAQSYRLPAVDVRAAIERKMLITGEYMDETSKIVLVKLTGRPDKES